MNHVPKKTQGFTIIELVLAMTFISVLLLAIALTIIQIGTIYNKGMTLKEVNQTGRIISDNVTRSLSGSGAFSLTTNLATSSSGGRLCLGQYSYIWNYARALENGDPNLTRYADSTDEVHMVKVPDPSAAYCARVSGAFVYTTIRAVDRPQSVELLKSGDRLLSIYQFAISSPPNGTDGLTGQQVYSVSFTIGAGATSALTPTMTSCLAPGQPNANFAYCAVQQFNLVIRAGNRVN